MYANMLFIGSLLEADQIIVVTLLLIPTLLNFDKALFL